MHAIIAAAALWVAMARALALSSCADLCKSLATNNQELMQRQECVCSFEEKSKEPARFFNHYTNMNNIPVHNDHVDHAIYYAPSDLQSYPSVSFAENSFYISNIAFKDEQGIRNLENRKMDELQSYGKRKRSTNGNHRKTSNIVSKIDIETDDIPFYLDIDIHKSDYKEQLSEKTNGEDIMLSEIDLIECIDLHIVAFSRSNDINKDYGDIWNDNKKEKYENLSDSDIIVQIQNKCHHPANLFKESLEEITNSRPRKSKFNSEDKTFAPNVNSKSVPNTINREDMSFEKGTEHVLQHIDINMKLGFDNVLTTEYTTKSIQDENILDGTVLKEQLISDTEERKHIFYSKEKQPLNNLSKPTTHDPNNVLTKFHKLASTTTTDFSTNRNDTELARTESNLPSFNDLFTTTSNIFNIKQTYLPASKYFKDKTIPDKNYNIYYKFIEPATVDPSMIELSGQEPTQRYRTLNPTFKNETNSSYVKLITDPLHETAKGNKTYLQQYLISTTPLSRNKSQPSQTSRSYFADGPTAINDVVSTTTTKVYKSDIDKNNVAPYNPNSYSDSKNFKKRNEHIKRSSNTTSDTTSSDAKVTVTNSTRYNSTQMIHHNDVIEQTGESPLAQNLNNPDLSQSQSKTSTLIIPAFKNNLTTTSSDHFTTESVLYKSDHSRILNINKNKDRIEYPEKEIIIQKIITKELYNDTVISELKGFEDIPNNDFVTDLMNPTLSDNGRRVNDQTVDLTNTRTPPINLDINKRNEIDNKIIFNKYQNLIGSLYFVFDKNKVPARFVQESNGQIKIGIDGKSLCDKLLEKHQNNSVFLVTLCKCLQSENFSKLSIKEVDVFNVPR